MINKIPRSGNESCKKFEELGLEEKNIEEVLAGFRIAKGMEYDPNVYNDRGMKRPSENTPATCQITVIGSTC